MCTAIQAYVVNLGRDFDNFSGEVWSLKLFWKCFLVLLTFLKTLIEGLTARPDQMCIIPPNTLRTIIPFDQKEVSIIAFNKISVLIISYYFWSVGVLFEHYKRKHQRWTNRCCLLFRYGKPKKLKNYPHKIEHTKQLLTFQLWCVFLSLPGPWL